jgi:hypothetical protein
MAFVSFIMAVPTLLNLFKDRIVESTVAEETSITFLDRLVRAFRVIVVEVGQLILMDSLLFILILTGIYLSFRNFGTLESQIFLGFLIAGTLLDCYVGEVGVNMRYQLPALAVLPLVLQNGFGKLSKESISLK